MNAYIVSLDMGTLVLALDRGLQVGIMVLHYLYAGQTESLPPPIWVPESMKSPVEMAPGVKFG